jgi:chorismate mutase
MSELSEYRQRLDAIDDQILALLGERFLICRSVAAHKQIHAIPVMQNARVAEVRARYFQKAALEELPLDFVEQLFELTIAATCRLEAEILGEDLQSSTAAR